LRKLGEICRKIVDTSGSDEKLVAFVLMELFNTLAEDQEERPVSLSGGKETLQLVDAAVWRAIEFLVAGNDNSNVVRMCSDIIDCIQPRPNHS
jgi:hypothetical protein